VYETNVSVGSLAAHNMGFAKMGADGSGVSTFCFSIGLHIGRTLLI